MVLSKLILLPILAFIGPTVLPRIIEESKILASDGATNDKFGFSVSLSEDTLAVGAYEKDVFGSDSGMVYLYELSDESNEWEEIAQLSPQNSATRQLGYSVCLHGSSLIAGAHLDGGPNDEPGRGAAYIYNRNHDGVWEEAVQLLAHDGLAGDQFGYSVSLHRNTAVVTSWMDEENLEPVGKAYVFERLYVIPESWSQLELVPESVEGDFGWSVAVYEDTIAVGMRTIDVDTGEESGAVIMFLRDNGGPGNWGESQKLTPHDASQYNNFGFSVAISEDILAVGAYGDSEAEIDAGAVYVFRKQPSGFWHEEAKLLSSDPHSNALLGYSVAVASQTVLAGAPLVGYMGAAYVFQQQDDSWIEVAELLPEDGDSFGTSVAMSFSTYLVGSYSDDVGGIHNAGAVYYFWDSHTSIAWDECEMECYEYLVDTQCFICELNWNRQKKVEVQTTGVTVTFVDTGLPAYEGDYPDYAILSNLFTFLAQTTEDGGYINGTYSDICGIPEDLYVDPYIGPEDDEFWVVIGDLTEIPCDDVDVGAAEDCPSNRVCLSGDIRIPENTICCAENEVCVTRENPEEGGSCIPKQDDGEPLNDEISEENEEQHEEIEEAGSEEIEENGEEGEEEGSAELQSAGGNSNKTINRKIWWLSLCALFVSVLSILSII